MINRIHHVQITIPSGAEDAARTFYRDVLGLEEIDKPASLRGRGGLWLRLADQEVHLGIEDDPGRAGRRAHVAFEVGDLPGWRERLGARGVEVTESIAIPGLDRFEFRDPFGNRLELLAPSTSQPAVR